MHATSVSHLHTFVVAIFAAFCAIRVPSAPMLFLCSILTCFVFCLLEACQCICLDIQSDSLDLSPKLQISTYEKILRFRRRRQLPKPTLCTSYGLYTQTRSAFLVYMDNLLDFLVTVLLWDNPV